MRILLILFGLLVLTNCSGNHLRGQTEKSADKKTYLVFKEKDCADCPIYVDGKIWEYGIGQKGEILPGTHTIECGGKLEIEIKEGTTFIFDYWGP
jgi:hypothetical protein